MSKVSFRIYNEEKPIFEFGTSRGTLTLVAVVFTSITFAFIRRLKKWK